MLRALAGKHLLALAAGEKAIRFRLPLVITAEEIQIVLERVAACMPTGARA
jgi:acetylornithine/succinyldiaminopimelate/putrescine aminotransferase